MSGTVCRRHFDAVPAAYAVVPQCTHVDGRGMCRVCYLWFRAVMDAVDAEQDACPDCIAAREERRRDIQQNDTIDPAQPWGQHIALTCRNHPELRWHTKNISHIGARSIFFAGRDMSTECACPGSDLIVVPQS